MTLRSLMQAGPAKANELFAKLSETSDGAVKTRERLFAELKAELEFHTSLEEQHLFPVLRRNPETKDLVADIRNLVGQKGPDKVIETTGARAVIELAYDITHPDGTCVLVGVPSEKVTIYTLPIHFNKVLTGSHGGDAAPHVDIPRLIRLNLAGRLSFEGLVTHEFALDDINAAIDLVRSGAAGRVLIDMKRS